MIGFTRTKEGLSLTINGESFYLLNTSPVFEEAKEALREGNEEHLLSLVDKKKQIINFTHSLLELRDNTLYFQDKPLPYTLSQKILNLYEEGFPFEPFIRFYERLQQTSSNTVLTQLLDYLEAGEWPLMPDGRIMAYKVVKLNPYKGTLLSESRVQEIRNKQQPAQVIYKDRSNTIEDFQELLCNKDYIDIYSSSVPQGIGDILSVPRNTVDDNRDITCSHGLHIASYSYTKHYGNAITGDDVVLLVAVCPSNWISVPRDYQCAKARVCSYEVLQVHKELTEIRNALFLSSQYEEINEEDDYEYDEYEEELED